LSLFRGGFTAEAAAQTAEADANLLAEWVKQYWLAADKAGRYHWRNRPQQYVMAQLDHFDPDAARDQQAAYYAQRLAQLWPVMRGAGFLTAVNQIKQEIDNIRAAWQWAVRRRQLDWLNQMMAPLWLFYAENEWIVEGLDRFGWAAVELADAAAPPAQQIVRNQLLAHQAWFYHLKDENKAGAAIIKEAVNNLRQLDAGWPLALAQLTAGAIYYRRRRYDEAKEAWQTSAALFAQLEDEWGEALCLNRLGEVVRRVGQYDQAKLLYAQSLAMFQELEYPLGLAWVFSNLAVVAREEGDYDHALSLLGDSLRLSQANRRYQAVCICLTISGQIKLLQGNYREAYPLCLEAYELASERGDELSAAFSARYLGHISLETAKFAQAERFYTASQAAFWRAGDISGVATSYAHLAEVARQQNNWEAAEQLARQGIKQADSDRKNLYTDMLELMAALARIYADTQRPEQAARLLAFVRSQGMGRQVVLDKMHYCEQLIAPALSAAQQTAAAEWGNQQSVESVLDWLESPKIVNG
jgi:tetratricopeptide (TPR) repeat protein